MSTNILIGKTINAIFIADDKEALRFDLEGGEPIIVRCDADCCSHTWVETIENAGAAIGSSVLEAKSIEMPDLGSPYQYDYIAYYGFRIRTAKGDCIIDFRNSSNGYYGGSLVWPDDEYFYGGVNGQNVSSENWKAVP